MTPDKRSTLQLDLKDLTPGPSTPVLRHLGLASVTLGALVGTYVLVNAPSASTGTIASVVETSPPSAPLAVTAVDAIPTVTRDEAPTTPVVNAETRQAMPAPIEKSALTRQGESIRSVAATGSPSFDGVVDSPRPTVEHTGPSSDLNSLASLQRAVSAAPDNPGVASSGSLLGGLTASMWSSSPVARDGSFHPPELEPVDFNDPQSIRMASLGLPNPAPTSTVDNSTPLFDSGLLRGLRELSLGRVTIVEPEIDPGPVIPEFDWITVKVKKKDTLSRMFERHGIRIQDAYQVADLEDASILMKVRPGEELMLARNEDGSFAALKYPRNQFSELYVLREEGALRVEEITRTPEIRVRTESATIWTSLLGAAEKADVDYETMYSLMRLFGWQIDFAREIQSGDRFAVIFEELYLDDRKVGNGEVIAAELVSGGKILRAVRHVDEDGHARYFTPEGEGIQGSFLRNPVKFARVTSGFSKKRFHPIQKKWKAHKGVDYGAPRGTPVLSTGNGVVRFAGKKRGYGNVIEIRHGGSYQTLYAHLHRVAKGIKTGSRVKQGEVIGYVGSTGWATGPHLHYEFRIDGVHRNPLTVELPRSAPIERKYHSEFVASAGEWTAQLDRVSRIAVAELESQ